MQSSICFIFNIQIRTRGMYTYISYTSDLQGGDPPFTILSDSLRRSWGGGLEWGTIAARLVGSRRSQIPDQQARYVVHKPSCFPVSEDVWATQDCRMCQRFLSLPETPRGLESLEIYCGRP